MYKFRTNTSNSGHAKKKQKSKKKKCQKSSVIKNDAPLKDESPTEKIVIPPSALSSDIQSFLQTNKSMPYIHADQNYSHIVYFDAGYYYCNSFLMLNATPNSLTEQTRMEPVKQTKKNK